MNDEPQKIVSEDERADIAIRWFIEHDDPECPPEQWEALARWITADLDNCRAYLRAERNMRGIGLRDRFEPLIVIPTERPAPGRKRRFHISELADRRLGAVVRQCRKERDIPLERLAGDSGLEPERLRAVESGVYALSFVQGCVLAMAMEMKPPQLTTRLQQALSPGKRRSRR